MPYLAHRSLVKPFEPSSRAAALRRPEDADAGGAQIVGDAGHQRRLRPDHNQVDRLVAAEIDDCRMVGDIERHAFGVLGNAGIARGGIEPGQQRRRRQFPGQRMLAAARADEEDVHTHAFPTA